MSDGPTNPVSDSVLNDSSSIGLSPAARAAVIDQRPEQVGPYRILELIGEGGMGEVYKAERRHPIRQTVAVKVIKLGFDSREIVGRFESERQALAMMDHPAIAKVLDAGTTLGGRPYFVMEYVGGRPITAFCDEHRLSIRERLGLFEEACDAISHAHTKAIIHRDIKPGNVLAYVQDGRPAVKVIDFGIAKALTGNRLTDLTVNTAQGRVIGTYDCMSPEQADGSPDIDTRTDVYSLGVLLYELLTGARPFDHKSLSGATDEEIRRVIREVDPPRPSTRLTGLDKDEARALAGRRQARLDALARQLSDELEWIPLKAMRKERARRYDSPQQLKEDVENYLQGKPLLAGPESHVYRVRKFARRNWRGVAASAAMVVVLVTGAVLYVHNIRAEQTKTRLALLESERQRGEAQKQAKIANDSSNFLASIFRDADPSKSRGHDITMVEAMQETIKRLDSGWLTPEPITESMVRYVVGTTLVQLGRYEDALPQLQRARELDAKYRSPDDLQTATTIGDLALLLSNQGKFDQAEALYREALRREQAVPAVTQEDHRNIGKSLLSIGSVLRSRQKFDEAESMLRQALDYQRKNLPPGDLDEATTLNNLAALKWNQGKLDEAEPLCREVLKLRQAALPPDHPNVAQSLGNLAILLGDKKKYDEAEPLARQALELRRKILPPEHPDTAATLYSLASILNGQHKYAEAEPYAREALRIRRVALPADHPFLATTCADLAWLLQQQAKLAEAEPLYREALGIRAARFGANAAPTTKTAGLLADLLDQTGRPGEASAIRATTLPATSQPATQP